MQTVMAKILRFAMQIQITTQKGLEIKNKKYCFKNVLEIKIQSQTISQIQIRNPSYQVNHSLSTSAASQTYCL